MDRYAIQLYGIFRTFEHCLPQILTIANFYNNPDQYDIYILTQKQDPLSTPDNVEKIKQICQNRIVYFAYIEDILDESMENTYCNIYDQCVQTAKQQFPNISNNSFSTRMWYRRYLINLIRQKTGIYYKVVIRTRFDIGNSHLNQVLIDLNNIDPETIYVTPDIISYGSSEVIDYESKLIFNWPYIWNNQYYSDYSVDKINKWLFMSEMNLTEYLQHSKYRYQHVDHRLKIIRFILSDRDFNCVNSLVLSPLTDKIYYGDIEITGRQYRQMENY